MSNRVVMPAPGSRFHNIKIEVNGMLFDSKGEAKRYTSLFKEYQAGLIQNLRCQVPFKLSLNGAYICTYIADFTYTRNNEFVVEDYKGVMTDVFKEKRKLMKKCHNIKILITRKSTK